MLLRVSLIFFFCFLTLKEAEARNYLSGYSSGGSSGNYLSGYSASGSSRYLSGYSANGSGRGNYLSGYSSDGSGRGNYLSGYSSNGQSGNYLSGYNASGDNTLDQYSNRSRYSRLQIRSGSRPSIPTNVTSPAPTKRSYVSPKVRQFYNAAGTQNLSNKAQTRTSNTRTSNTRTTHIQNHPKIWGLDAYNLSQK